MRNFEIRIHPKNPQEFAFWMGEPPPRLRKMQFFHIFAADTKPTCPIGQAETPLLTEELYFGGEYHQHMGKITDLLEERFSVRTFQPRPVPQPVLDEILEAGRLSPSGGNEQPWRFGVITDPNLIVKVAQLACRQDWIGRAPLLIILCTVFVEDARGGREIQMQRYPEYAGAIASMDQGLYRALNQEEHQTKIAGTHMVLAAQEHGVGSCWVSRFDVLALAGLLDLPEGVLPAEILVFGYPQHLQKPLPKKSLEELVFFKG
jgi:nitroreductase